MITVDRQDDTMRDCANIDPLLLCCSELALYHPNCIEENGFLWCENQRQVTCSFNVERNTRLGE